MSDMSEVKKFLRLPAVIEATGQSRSTILRAVKAGKFPAPVHIGSRAVAWDSAAVSRWHDDCLAAAKRSASQDQKVP